MIWTAGFGSRQKQEMFPFFQSVCQPSLLCSGYLGAVSQGAQQSVSETDHSPPRMEELYLHCIRALVNNQLIKGTATSLSLEYLHLH
jgi:hypothetical protein